MSGAATAPRGAPAGLRDGHAGPSFGTALRIELLKVLSTRMWWILLVVMVAYVAVIAAFITFSFSVVPEQAVAQGAPTLADRGTVLAMYTLVLPLGYVFPVLVGVLAITTEYRYQTLTPTFLAQPRRTQVLTAKLVVATMFGLAFGVVGVAACVGPVAAVLAATGNDLLLDGQTWRALGQTVLALGLWAAVGLGVGVLVRNQVAAIVIVVAFSQLVEPMLRFGLMAWEATRSVSRFLPGAAGDAMAGASLYTVGAPVDLLTWWQGGLVLLAYAFVLFAVGAATTARRDVA